MRRAALIAILIFAACGGDSETTSKTTAAPVLTTLAAAPPATTTTTTAAPATTTSTTTTTTTLPPNAAAEFGLTQVVFGEGSLVVITNWGNDTGNLQGHWLCQFPAYKSLPDIELAPGEQALIGLSNTPPPDLAGMAVTVDLGPAIGIFNAATGEVALYDNQAFDDPDGIVAYVEWGESGHARSGVAVEAGIWSIGTVEILDEAPSISSGVFPASSSTDWSADIGG